LLGLAPTLGAVTGVHDVPFQCSISPNGDPLLVASEPTAQQSDADMHVTPAKA
jgi:hypothetical protein